MGVKGGRSGSTRNAATWKAVALAGLLAAAAVAATGCIPGDGAATMDAPAGFLWGIWHGWIAPVSLVVGIFQRDIRIYEVANTGWWYDFGFYLAIVGGFGGLALSRRRKRTPKD
jgi:hypothetical protein